MIRKQRCVTNTTVGAFIQFAASAVCYLLLAANVDAESPAKGAYVRGMQQTPYQVMNTLRSALNVSEASFEQNEVDGTFHELDANGDKSLSRREFTEQASNAKRSLQMSIFQAADQNRNGSLSTTEHATIRSTIAEANRVFEHHDTNSDRVITHDEFVTNVAQNENKNWAGNVFGELDPNEDRKLQPSEFLAVWLQWTAAPKAPPTPHENVKYGPYERNVLDLWLPKSDTPTPLIVFIHGGGFSGGSKESAWQSPNVQQALDHGVAFASIQYRLRYDERDLKMSDPQRTGIQHILRDAARAIQYVRAHAAEYNLDKPRVACYGGSAGAGTSIWLATHDDLADPQNADPVLHESSRIAAAGMLAGQFTYDLESWDVEFKSRGGNIRKTHGRGRPRMPYWRFFGLSEKKYRGPEGKRWRADVDMYNLVSADDAPIYAMTGSRDRYPANANIYNHHPYHALLIEKACVAQGVEVECRVPQVREEDASYLRENPDAMMQFLLRHLGALSSSLRDN